MKRFLIHLLGGYTKDDLHLVGYLTKDNDGDMYLSDNEPIKEGSQWYPSSYEDNTVCIPNRMREFMPSIDTETVKIILAL